MSTPMTSSSDQPLVDRVVCTNEPRMRKRELARYEPDDDEMKDRKRMRACLEWARGEVHERELHVRLAIALFKAKTARDDMWEIKEELDGIKANLSGLSREESPLADLAAAAVNMAGL